MGGAVRITGVCALAPTCCWRSQRLGGSPWPYLAAMAKLRMEQEGWSPKIHQPMPTQIPKVGQRGQSECGGEAGQVVWHSSQ